MSAQRGADEVWVIDLGNSRMKWARFARLDAPALVEPLATGHFSYEDARDAVWAVVPNSPLPWAYVNVARRDAPLLGWVSERLGPPALECTPFTPSRLTLRYATPHTLGADRYLAAVAGVERFAPRPVLVIDLGTAVTYDYIDTEGQYWGGGIGPGLSLRYQALHAYTARLPRLMPITDPAAEAIELVGTTTEASLRSGVQLGMLAEVEGLMGLYRARAPELAVVLTGGDAPWFEKHLKSPIFAAPNAVLQGAHLLLTHQLATTSSNA